MYVGIWTVIVRPITEKRERERERATGNWTLVSIDKDIDFKQIVWD